MLGQHVRCNQFKLQVAPVASFEDFTLCFSCLFLLVGSQCVGPWQTESNNHECVLPVYDKMTWYGAFAHCRRLDSEIFAGNFFKIEFVDASHLNVTTSSFWTKNLYEIVLQRTANWTWNAGCLVERTSLWNILDTYFSRGKCGVSKNNKIYLTSNCTQISSNVCKANTSKC